MVTDVERMLQEEGVDCLTPDLPPEIIGDINISPALRRWKDELVQGARVKYELAVLRQRKVTETVNRLELCHMEGIGKRVAALDMEFAFRLEGMLGKRWWFDRELLHKVLHDNPWLQIRCVPRTLTLRVNGLRDQRTEDRGRKNLQQSDRGGRGCGTRANPAAPVKADGNRRRVSARECFDHESPARPGQQRDAVPNYQSSRRSEPWMVPVMEAAGLR